MKRFYRSVWISDVHLCTRDSQAEHLTTFLDSIKCDYLYLVGDIIDVWAMRKRWHWPREYNELLHKLLKRARKGAQVTFIPGNHDEFFREFDGLHFGDVAITKRTIHTMADGRRFLVTHGDEFDAIVMYHKWLSHLGSRCYNHLIQLNRFVNWVRRCWGMPYWSMSGAIKRRVKGAVSYINDFESTMTREARREKVDGVICGHIHHPLMTEYGDFVYCNTGDWVEHCTALVEHMDGTLEIIWWHSEVDERCAGMAEAVAFNGQGRNGPSANGSSKRLGETVHA